jgi:hypothetical protein
MKKFLITLVIVAIVACPFLLFACNNGNGYENGESTWTPIDDSGYVLTIRGLRSETDVIEITKGEIVALYEALLSVESRPAYLRGESDIFVAEGRNARRVKGVYLNDILAKYDTVLSSASFYTLGITSYGGREFNVLPATVFNPEIGGSNMIIAFWLDGRYLNQADVYNNGALRAIFPNQSANTWWKRIQTLQLGNAAVSFVQPPVTQIYFLETLPQNYFGTFTNRNMLHHGLSLEALFDSGKLGGEANDFVYITAWDFNESKNLHELFFRIRRQQDITNAFIVFEQPAVSDPNQTRRFVLDGEDMPHTLRVSNTAALTVGSTAIVTLSMMFEVYQSNGIMEMSNLFEYFQLPTDGYYTIETDNGTVQLSGEMLKNATLKDIDDNFKLTYGNNQTLIMKSFSLN